MAFSSKLIVVLVDGLKESTARKCCGFLMGLVEEKRGTLFSVVSELPSLSRPLYETLFTGRVPVTGGFVTNSSQRKAGAASVFDLVKAAGGVTALAGYGWM